MAEVIFKDLAQAVVPPARIDTFSIDDNTTQSEMNRIIIKLRDEDLTGASSNLSSPSTHPSLRDSIGLCFYPSTKHPTQAIYVTKAKPTNNNNTNIDHNPNSSSPSTDSSNINNNTNNNNNNNIKNITPNPTSLLPLTEEEINGFLPKLGADQWTWANVDRTAIFVFFDTTQGEIVPYWLEKKEATIVFAQHPLVAEFDQLLFNYEALNVQKFSGPIRK